MDCQIYTIFMILQYDILEILKIQNFTPPPTIPLSEPPHPALSNLST